MKDVPIKYKQVKKVTKKNVFIKDESVFREYKEDSEELCKRCFEYDMQYSKIKRFIKDNSDVSLFY